jgi:hypothetical protein
MVVVAAPTTGPDVPGVGDAVVCAVAAAAGGLGRARPDGVDAEAAVGVVLAARCGNDKLIWPHCAGLIWPHPLVLLSGLSGGSSPRG